MSLPVWGMEGKDGGLAGMHESNQRDKDDVTLDAVRYLPCMADIDQMVQRYSSAMGWMDSTFLFLCLKFFVSWALLSHPSM